MLEPTAAIAAAERIRSRVGARVHRLGQPDEITEDAMPRKASTEPKVVKVTKITDPIGGPKKRGRKPGSTNAKKAAPTTGPRFGVFDDGSVALNLPSCKGQMIPQEAREFIGFLAKIGVKA